MYNVSEKTPPVFMMHAANDSMVPAINSLNMANQLVKNNIPYELHIFESGEHGFATGANMGESIYRLDKYKNCSSWFDACRKWLLNIVAPETKIKDVTAAQFFEAGGNDNAFLDKLL